MADGRKGPVGKDLELTQHRLSGGILPTCTQVHAKANTSLFVVGYTCSSGSLPPTSSGARYRSVPPGFAEDVCPEGRPSRIQDSPKSLNIACPILFMRTFCLCVLIRITREGVSIISTHRFHIRMYNDGIVTVEVQETSSYVSNLDSRYQNTNR